jgi:phage-related protein
MFNSIGVEYSSEDVQDIELNLALYNPLTNEPLSIDEINMDEIMDWLITEDYVPFISDDDLEIIYYFKVVNLKKMLTFEKQGYLNVVFEPFTKYVYKREENEQIINGNKTIKIYNESKEDYYPIIEITNKGDETTINKVNDMEIVNLKKNEKIIIDNLTKMVQSDTKENKFSCCNRKWIKLNKRNETSITFNGNMVVRIICEFPLIR